MSERQYARSKLLASIIVGAALGPHFIAASAPLAPLLELSACRLSDAQGLVSHAARCGKLSVPEDPQDPGGARIELAITVVPAISTRARPDPLFLIAGGPGQGAREAYAPMLGAFAGLNRERDLVMVDQRGTGDSNRLDCHFPERAWQANELSPEEIATVARDCLRELPGRPGFYTTSIAVRDLDLVRAALGYAQINLLGVSYGTRVVQHYARRFPERARAVVLDAVVAPELVLGPEIALAAQRAVDQIFARCAADAECHARFPALPEQFAALAQRLREAPIALQLPDPVTGETRTVEAGYGHLVMATRLLAYSTDSASLLPYFIHEANTRDNLLPLVAQAEVINKSLDRMLAFGMHNSVVCSEDAPRFTRIDRAALERSFIGPLMVDGIIALCSEWPAGAVDDDFHEPLNSQVPALLLSGEADPATPDSYAVIAARGFSRHLNLVFAGQGHGQTRLACTQRLVRLFIEQGSADGLDTACVDQVTAAPFFLSAAGPAP